MSVSKQRPIPAAPRRHPDPEKAGEGARELPTGWMRTTLGAVLPLKYGKARAPGFGYVREETATYGSNGAFGTFNRALTTKPAIVVGRKGAAGAVHYSPEPCWPIDTAFYTEENDRTFLPFFRYLLESLQLVALDRSTAIPSLSRDDYDAKTVCYPESVAEQRRIVAEIEKQFTRLEVGIAALKRVQANLSRYRAAVLKAACEGCLVPTEPAGWRDATFGDVCHVQCGFAFKSGDYRQSGVPLIRIASLVDGKVTLDGKTAFLPVDYLEKYADFVLKNGDVLIAMSGATTGKMATFSLEGPALLNQRVGRFQIRLENACSARFMALIVEQIRQQVIRDAYGAAQPNISPKQIESMPFRLPPTAEQTRIVEEVERRLSVVEELSALVTANLQRASRLRQAVLQKAFEGKLC